MADSPRISIIIPVRNEGRTLPGLLDELFQQTYNHELFEIIVADGGSTDGTAQLVSTLAQAAPVKIRILDNPGIRSSSGRNVGVAAANGDIILFLDGHCHLPSRLLLAETVRILQSTGAGCLCRPQPLIAPQSSATGRAIAAVRGSLLGHGRDSLIYDMTYSGFVDPSSSGATYTRQALLQVGPYDERFDACEDVELNTRIKLAGIPAYTDPALAVYYQPRSSIRGLFKQMARYGRGRIRLAAKHTSTLSFAMLVPLLFLVLALTTVAVAIVTTRFRLFALLLAAAYVLIILTASIQLGLRGNRRCYWQAPLIYPAIHFGLGWGMLVELLSFHWLRMRASST